MPGTRKVSSRTVISSKQVSSTRKRSSGSRRGGSGGKEALAAVIVIGAAAGGGYLVYEQFFKGKGAVVTPPPPPGADPTAITGLDATLGGTTAAPTITVTGTLEDTALAVGVSGLIVSVTTSPSLGTQTPTTGPTGEFSQLLTGAAPGTTYTIGIVFAGNSSYAASTASVMVTTPSNTAPPPSTFTIDVDTAPISGFTINLYESDLTTLITTQFSPASFTGIAAGTYGISVDDYGQYTFEEWEDGSTHGTPLSYGSAVRAVTISADETYTATYTSSGSGGGGGTGPSLAYTAETQALVPITGLNVFITSDEAGQNMIASAFSPYTFTTANGLISGNTYYIWPTSAYGQYTFVAWEDNGTFEQPRPFVFVDEASLTALYST